MKRSSRGTLFALLLGAAAAGLVLSSESVRNFLGYLWTMQRRHTVEERLTQHGSAVEQRLRERFAAVGLDYPAQQLAYVSFKDVQRLEVYGRMSREAPWTFVTDYPILAASGVSGPKLREGDLQVPEGIYEAESLNPNSKFHLSIRLSYPNVFDRKMAQLDGRSQLGSDIMIHGGASSIGCLAIGNDGAEDLFVLTALVGSERVRIVVSPTDFREAATPASMNEPAWVGDLYASLRTELQQYRRHAD
jgi:murein L,D-transpeptidase YafK